MCEHLRKELADAFAEWRRVPQTEYLKTHNIRKADGNRHRYIADTHFITGPAMWCRLAYIADRALCETCAEAEGRPARTALIDVADMKEALWYRDGNDSAFLTDYEESLFALDGLQAYERTGRKGPRIVRFPSRAALVSACPTVERRPRKSRARRDPAIEAIRQENAELRSELAQLKEMLTQRLGSNEPTLPF